MTYLSDKKPLELSPVATLEDDDTVIVGDTSDTTEVVKSITKANLITTLGVGSGGGGSNTDGGTAESVYGGLTAIDGGDATT